MGKFGTLWITSLVVFWTLLAAGEGQAIPTLCSQFAEESNFAVVQMCYDSVATTSSRIILDALSAEYAMPADGAATCTCTVSLTSGSAFPSFTAGSFDGKSSNQECGTSISIQNGKTHACAVTLDFVYAASSDVTLSRSAEAPPGGYWYGYCLRLDIALNSAENITVQCHAIDSSEPVSTTTPSKSTAASDGDTSNVQTTTLFSPTPAQTQTGLMEMSSAVTESSAFTESSIVTVTTEILPSVTLASSETINSTETVTFSESPTMSQETALPSETTLMPSKTMALPGTPTMSSDTPVPSETTLIPSETMALPGTPTMSSDTTVPSETILIPSETMALPGTPTMSSDTPVPSETTLIPSETMVSSDSIPSETTMSAEITFMPMESSTSSKPIHSETALPSQTVTHSVVFSTTLPETTTTTPETSQPRTNFSTTGKTTGLPQTSDLTTTEATSSGITMTEGTTDQPSMTSQSTPESPSSLQSSVHNRFPYEAVIGSSLGVILIIVVAIALPCMSRRNNSYDTSATADLSLLKGHNKTFYPPDTRPETSYYDNPSTVVADDTELQPIQSRDYGNSNDIPETVIYANKTFGKTDDNI